MPSIRKKSFAAEQLALRQKKKSPVVWVLVGVIVVALVGGGYMVYQRAVSEKQVETEAQQIKSVAVLPFRDMSQEKDQDWFCEGLSEGIINALTKVSDLQVTGRTSAFAFKDKDLGIPEIGEQLKVEAVLEGSILKSGNRILITAQLINVSDGFHLWSEEYDRELKDVIDMRAEISMKIVEALKGELLGEEKEAIEKRYTENTEAYNLYLQGRHFWQQRSHEDLEKALMYFRQAIDKDQDYALAYTGIADVYNLLGNHGYMYSKDAHTEAQKYARKALEIDDTLAEAHNSLAFAILYGDWNLTDAEKEFKKAIELNPGYGLTYWWYKDCLMIQGRLEEALAELKKGLKLDPLNFNVFFGIIRVNIYLGRCDEAQAEFNKLLEVYPVHEWNDLIPVILSLCRGEYQSTITDLERMREKSTWQTGSFANFLDAELGFAYGMSGQYGKAKIIAREMLERNKDAYSGLCSVAAVYAGAGDNDKAFEWLEKAYDIRDPWILLINVAPRFETLRKDPRFKALLKKMNLPAE